MIAVQIARIIADYITFLELTDESIMDPDVAIKEMEGVADRLTSLDRPFLHELVNAFPEIAAEYGKEAEQVVRDIPHSFYLEEELAKDDPARLAELEKLRDARDVLTDSGLDP